MGLDVGAIGCISLFGFGSGWKLSIWLFVIIFIRRFSIELRLPGGSFSTSPPSAILVRCASFKTILKMFTIGIVEPLIQVVAKIVDYVQKLIPETLVKKVLFGGEPTAYHQTKFFFQKLIERYEKSIEAVNRTFIINTIIIFFVTYPLLSEPSGSFKIPLIDFEIKNKQWLKIVPLITLSAQLLFLTSIIWFQILSRGIKISLLSRKENLEDFADTRHIALDGIVGIVHLLFFVRKRYTSKFHLIWYFPIFFLTIVVGIVPLILSIILIVILFRQHEFLLGSVYLILAVPIGILAYLLVQTSFLIFVLGSLKGNKV